MKLSLHLPTNQNYKSQLSKLNLKWIFYLGSTENFGKFAKVSYFCGFFFIWNLIFCRVRTKTLVNMKVRTLVIFAFKCILWGQNRLNSQCLWHLRCITLLPINLNQVQFFMPVQSCSFLFIMELTKTFPENWDSKASSVGTLLAYLKTTA